MHTTLYVIAAGMYLYYTNKMGVMSRAVSRSVLLVLLSAQPLDPFQVPRQRNDLRRLRGRGEPHQILKYDEILLKVFSELEKPAVLQQQSARHVPAPGGA